MAGPIESTVAGATQARHLREGMPTPMNDDTHDTSPSAPVNTQRNPAYTLAGCNRILVLGRTGSGKTTLALELAEVLDMPHVELDSLLFNDDRSAVPVEVLRERAQLAIAGERWITDGNKRALRDMVWPRADTVIWLDYPVMVSLWRLAKRARRRTATTIKTQSVEGRGKSSALKHLANAAKGVTKALRSHRGQRKELPKLFAEPKHHHLAVVRLTSPRATRQWLRRVVG